MRNSSYMLNQHIYWGFEQDRSTCWLKYLEGLDDTQSLCRCSLLSVVFVYKQLSLSPPIRLRPARSIFFSSCFRDRHTHTYIYISAHICLAREIDIPQVYNNNRSVPFLRFLVALRADKSASSTWELNIRSIPGQGKLLTFYPVAQGSSFLHKLC